LAYKFIKPALPLHYLVVPGSHPLSSLTFDLAAAPEKPEPGFPGPQVGDITLLKSEGRLTALVSLGKGQEINADTYRQAGGLAGKWLRSSGASEVDFEVSSEDFQAAPSALQAFLEGLILGAYHFNRYKKGAPPEKQVKIYLRPEKEISSLKTMVARIETIASAVYMARDWAHEPANVINPVTLAERACSLADYAGLECSILDMQALEAMGAGGIVNVGKGSKTPPQLIVLTYAGKNPPTNMKPIVLVGKALTFDSGGYSLKNAENIQNMKYDKCGGVTVAATLLAASELNVKTPIIGVIGAAENMVSNEAYRPDDIITTLSGKTVEIISTDAEGRLVLADALTYAQQHYQAEAIIDLATLTGAAIISLGRVRAGLMTNDDEFANVLLEAGEATHERLWRMPLDDDYFKQIKGDDADLKNSGGREGGTIIGGKFLQQFIEKGTTWAHLDIAGVADLPKDGPYTPKGATGFGIRLLIKYLESIG
jgi:leucyl aminopeptidase